MGCARSQPARVEGAGWPTLLPVAALIDCRLTAAPPDTEWFFQFEVLASSRQVVAVVGVGGSSSSAAGGPSVDGRAVVAQGVIGRTAAPCKVVLPGGAAVPCPAGAALLAAAVPCPAGGPFADALLTRGSGLVGDWRTLAEAACVLAATPWCAGRSLDASRPPGARRELCPVRRCRPGERCAAAFRQFYDEYAEVTLCASVSWAAPWAVVAPLAGML